MYQYRPQKILFAVLLTGLCSLSSAATLEHRPYLQNASPTSMVVRWRTDTGTDTRLSYGTSPGSLSTHINNPANTDEHEVKISGLTPGTRYYYSVGSSAETLAGGDQDHFFVTSPDPGTEQPVRIWVVGDSGTADTNAREVRDAYLDKTGNATTDLFLMLGDNAYNDGTDSQYTSAVFDMYPMVMRQTPTWSTLGNHDGRSANSSSQSGTYYNVFTFPANGEAGGLASGTEAYYSFDYANIHFVCLNSEDISRATNGAMLTWLRSDLGNTTQPWIIAFWHHPPYSKGSHDSDREDKLIDMRENALPILEDHGVDLVLSGHSHAYERSYLLNGHYGPSSSLNNTMKIDNGDGRISGDGAYIKTDDKGAVYVVAGSSGKTSGGPLNHPAMFISMDRLGSMAINVNSNHLDAEFIDHNGEIKDSFTITRGVLNQPPTFTSNQVIKADAKADEFYSTSIASNATDPDGDTVTFSKDSGPAWLTVEANGDLHGTPGASDVGNNSFIVDVSDDAANDTATLEINVNAAAVINQPPAFNSNPINAANAEANILYSASIASTASDPNGDSVSFSKISGPAWLTIDANGDLHGTPGTSDIGNNSFTVDVSDNNANDTATLNITVNAAAVINQPPAFNSNPINAADAEADILYSASIASNASDPDGDTLSFTKVSGPAWLSVSGNGTLSGTPEAIDSGLNSFSVSAADSVASTEVTLNINVLVSVPGNRPPEFLSNPIIELSAIENQSFSDSLSGHANDPDGNRLIFSKISGPAWLTIGANGDLHGTPGTSDVGNNDFTIRVSDGAASTDATMNINVEAENVNISSNSSGSISHWLLIILGMIGLIQRKEVKHN